MKVKKREILGIIFFVILDQFTKYIASVYLKGAGMVEVIKNFFYLHLVHNSGAAWSILEGQMWFFYILTVVMLGIFFMCLVKSDKKETWLRFAFVLIIAGTIGNFIDRLLFQQVTDFLDFYIFGYDFPVFNIADTELCIGAGIFALYALRHSDDEEKEGAK
ncbi:MAG: signal peptidase II [Erysipelotrichales bacterium]|nr:signal peptidase II [Erysipelotrichales bacterium]